MTPSIQFRQEAIKRAARMGITDQVKLIAAAQAIETFVWGGLAPIERPASTLATLTGDAEAIKAVIRGLIADESRDSNQRIKLHDALGVWERFIADVSAALGE